jgi:bacillithiol system protein YtxJ
MHCYEAQQWLSRSKSGQSPLKFMPFKHLINTSQLAEISQASTGRLQMIFKHSTRCSISAAAKHRLEIASEALQREMDLHFLDLILHRDVSNEIATFFNTRHESPQVLLIDHGKVVFNVTHYDIDGPRILQQVQVLSNKSSTQPS